MKRDDLELYAMGEYDGDAGALEDELVRNDAARAMVAEEARLELLLRDAAAAATFCPACDDLVRGARCDTCGAAVRPGGYVVERVLVSNAHGRMYAARDADGKQVALKELAFVQSPTVEVIAAFEREVKFLRALDHPAIPRFCASFEEGTGVHVRYYLAQELVAGESLADRLDAHWYSEAEIVGVARQVLDVLVYLQGLSPMVIHRDIKPANLVVRADGTIAVVDFGAAHVQGMTVGSTAIGTFGYMPIEQLAGEVDATTDPYALGASLLHLVTRKEPWRILHGGTLARLELNLSRPMRAFLCKLVAPQPRDRFRSAAEARAALDGLGRGRGRGRRRPIRAALVRLPARSMLALIAAAALAVIGVGGYAYWSDGESEAVAGRTAAFEARQTAMVAWMSSLRDLACLCTDKRCVDEVNRKVASWTQAMVADPLNREMMGRVNVLGAQMSECMRRVLPWLTLGSTRTHELEPVIAGDPAPAGTRVELRGTGMPVHEAAREMAEACGVNVVVSGRVDADLGTQQGPIPCERALATVVRWSGLHSRRHADWASADAASPEHGVFEIADPRTTSVDEARRDMFAERGFIDGPAPGLRDTIVNYALYQVPVQSVIQQLASAANLALAIPDSVGGTITVFARNADWDAVFAAVIDAASLRYRYDPTRKELYVSPLAELPRGQGAAPHAFLDVNPDAMDHATLVIDGTVTEVPPGRRIAVRAGTRRLELRKPDGSVTIYTLSVKAGSHAAIPRDSNPEVWENQHASAGQAAESER